MAKSLIFLPFFITLGCSISRSFGFSSNNHIVNSVFLYLGLFITLCILMSKIFDKLLVPSLIISFVLIAVSFFSSGMPTTLAVLFVLFLLLPIWVITYVEERK